MKRIIYLLIALGCLLIAKPTIESGKELLKKGDYKEALKFFKNMPESAEAAYNIALIYENGLGVPQDQKKANEWYKRSTTLMFGAKPVATPDNGQQKLNNTLKSNAEIQVKNSDQNKTVVAAEKYEKEYSLLPFHVYNPNYFLPFSYKTNGDYMNTFDNHIKTESVESEFQISFATNLFEDLLGYDETYTFAYTQQSFWQTYVSSPYFRETNYSPEFFVKFPMKELDFYGLDSMRFGYKHQSNGRGGLHERTWNRIYSGFLFKHGNFSTDLKLWYRIPDGEPYKVGVWGGDHNPDLVDYMGYGELNFEYQLGEHQFRTMFRYGNEKKVGAAELSWSYPFFGYESLYWFAKVFTGYGESLIDYDDEVTSFSLGISINR
jgi:phospholipase A1